MLLPLLAAASFSMAGIPKAFDGREGALVVVGCSSGETLRFSPALCATRFPPCSTFKIWNTAIGLETGLLTGAGQPFWKWDGVERQIPQWNHDLTLGEAYAASCVPAYQALARKIGPARMDEWLRKLGYGDRDTSSGNDVFWLPAPDRKAILISPDEQVALARKLAVGDLPFSATTLAALKGIMLAKTTARGTLYGKTGTGGPGAGTPAVGWFVGYLESGKSTFAFACLLEGKGSSGKEARTLVERAFASQGLL